MNTPKVSVIVPIYNVAPYIERCARSLFEQTLDEVEYVFVDDCSPDRSVEILLKVLDDYPKRKHQVKLIRQPMNWGAAAARKLGIENATGEYVIQCDSDDWVDRDMYRTLYEKAKHDDSDMVVCDWYDSDGTDNRHVRQSVRIERDGMISDLISRRLSASLWNRLVRRALFMDSEIVFPNAHMMEDVAYAIQLAYYSRSVAYLPMPMYYYYNNPTSICHEPSEASCMKRCRQAIDNINIVLAFLSGKKLLSKYATEVIVLKNSARVFLWPILMRHFRQNYRAWANVYPEINWQYPLKRGIDINLRIIFFLTLIGIYPLIHKIIKR